MSKKKRRKIGDRFDGTLIRDLDPIHIFTPVLYPDRCDSEAYISERIDMEPIRAYLDKLNAKDPEYHYTIFHVIVAAVLKTVMLRPKMNRFIANELTYQRNEVTGSFVVKKMFDDDGEEALAIVHAAEDETIFSMHDQIYDQIKVGRSDTLDSSMQSMSIVGKLPIRLVRTIARFVRWLEKRGKCPRTFIASDPYYTSVVFSNLGSIRLKSGYHHLTNWGTNSIFVAIGEIKETSFVNENDELEVKETVDLGVTIDERLADGYYYSRSVKLIKKLLAEPELLEHPFGEAVEY